MDGSHAYCSYDGSDIDRAVARVYAILSENKQASSPIYAPLYSAFSALAAYKTDRDLCNVSISLCDALEILFTQSEFQCKHVIADVISLRKMLVTIRSHKFTTPSRHTANSDCFDTVAHKQAVHSLVSCLYRCEEGNDVLKLHVIDIINAIESYKGGRTIDVSDVVAAIDRHYDNIDISRAVNSAVAMCQECSGVDVGQSHQVLVQAANVMEAIQNHPEMAVGDCSRLQEAMISLMDRRTAAISRDFRRSPESDAKLNMKSIYMPTPSSDDDSEDSKPDEPVLSAAIVEQYTRRISQLKSQL